MNRKQQRDRLWVKMNGDRINKLCILCIWTLTLTEAEITVNKLVWTRNASVSPEGLPIKTNYTSAPTGAVFYTHQERRTWDFNWEFPGGVRQRGVGIKVLENCGKSPHPLELGRSPACGSHKVTSCFVAIGTSISGRTLIYFSQRKGNKLTSVD